MEFKTDKVVLISHYSAVHPYKCEIVETNDNTLTIRLVKDTVIMDFSGGDPAVIIVKEGEKIFNIGCNVINIDQKANKILLRIDSIEPGSEMRRHERYPVSLYADIRLRGREKKHVAIVKDISFFGMKIFCKESFIVNEVLNLDLYMQQKIVFIKTVVLRKTEHTGYYEYGLRIEYDNYETLNFIKAFIRNLSGA